MITQERFDLIKQNWGELASWAVWEKMGETPRTNIGDLTIFKREEILEILNPKILFVGLLSTRQLHLKV